MAVQDEHPSQLPAESPRTAGQRRALERALEDSPLRGRALPQRVRFGRTTVEGYLAAVGGPPAYMARLREIERETAVHLERLEEAWRTLAAEESDSSAFGDRWHAVVRSWDFAHVNVLIERHNEYFPIEARLPMDPRSGDYVLLDGRPYTREPLDSAWALARFPASVEAAR